MFEIGTQLPLFIFPADFVYEEIACNWSSTDGSFYSGLLEEKLDECGEEFVQSILRDGIQMPVGMAIGNGVLFGNGHHRLAVAVEYGLPVPVIFDQHHAYLDDWTESRRYPNSGE